MHMGEVAICYGMTETSPVSTQTRADDSLERRVGTVGRSTRTSRSRSSTPRPGGPCRTATTGELCTRGYSVMLGYWEDAERPPRPSTRRGWMHTGDLATMDDDGYCNIVGRIKDMVIRGGENVYPREIEEFLYTHPDVADVQVIGVPDERIRRGGVRLGRAAGGRDGRRRVDPRVLPRHASRTTRCRATCKFVDEFPMTVTGKIQKYLMRETSIEQLGLERAAAIRSA